MNELFLKYWPDALRMHEMAIFPLPLLQEIGVEEHDGDVTFKTPKISDNFCQVPQSSPIQP